MMDILGLSNTINVAAAIIKSADVLGLLTNKRGDVWFNGNAESCHARSIEAQPITVHTRFHQQ